ncbi:hypothetical protein EVAR_59382_1 [Eumeta japonica]|uniref:Uncharacterized protein n=1 Tax=Eumeta variegata TaxID=151549 RepID=A0A4C1YKZ1_EUMVA|nr:hypothetical protein EVAR_59382_1 [Eumeta japonica]
MANFAAGGGRYDPRANLYITTLNMTLKIDLIFSLAEPKIPNGVSGSRAPVRPENSFGDMEIIVFRLSKAGTCFPISMNPVLIDLLRFRHWDSEKKKANGYY